MKVISCQGWWLKKSEWPLKIYKYCIISDRPFLSINRFESFWVKRPPYTWATSGRYVSNTKGLHPRLWSTFEWAGGGSALTSQRRNYDVNTVENRSRGRQPRAGCTLPENENTQVLFLKFLNCFFIKDGWFKHDTKSINIPSLFMLLKFTIQNFNSFHTVEYQDRCNFTETENIWETLKDLTQDGFGNYWNET